MCHNFMMNFDDNISNKKIKSFIESIACDDQFSYFIVVDGDVLIQNKSEFESVDIYWSINRNFDGDSVWGVSEMTISNDFDYGGDILNFIHNLSIFLETIIYTDADILYMPEKYYAVWCIDGAKRRIFFDDGNGNFIDHYNVVL